MTTNGTDFDPKEQATLQIDTAKQILYVIVGAA